MNSMKLVLLLHFISWKKTPNDAVTPQRQSQFTPKMKENAVPRLLSSLVWIDHYNECNGMTSFMEFMLGLLSHSCHVHIYTSFLRRPPILTTQAARQDWIELEAIHVDLKSQSKRWSANYPPTEDSTTCTTLNCTIFQGTFHDILQDCLSPEAKGLSASLQRWMREKYTAGCMVHSCKTYSI